MIKKDLSEQRNATMTERNAADTWDVIKKDSLFLEAVCLYLESEEILDENAEEIFKRLWFCKACKGDMKDTGTVRNDAGKKEKQKIKRQKGEAHD